MWSGVQFPARVLNTFLSYLCSKQTKCPSLPMAAWKPPSNQTSVSSPYRPHNSAVAAPRPAAPQGSTPWTLRTGWSRGCSRTRRRCLLCCMSPRNSGWQLIRIGTLLGPLFRPLFRLFLGPFLALLNKEQKLSC